VTKRSTIKKIAASAMTKQSTPKSSACGTQPNTSKRKDAEHQRLLGGSHSAVNYTRLRWCGCGSLLAPQPGLRKCLGKPFSLPPSFVVDSFLDPISEPFCRNAL
jgi:hypothetical protein